MRLAKRVFGAYLAIDLVGKRLELLKERVPQIGRVAILARPQHPGDHLERQASEAAARKLGLVYPTSRIRHRLFRRASSASLTRFFARLARKVAMRC